MTSTDRVLALSAKNLNKAFGDFHVLKNLSLDIELGAIHGIVGLNGSGKTTSLDCLLGLQRFDSGTVTLLGLEPAKLHQAKGDVVAIFDTPSLNPNLTVRQTLNHALLLCDSPVRTPAEVETLLGIERFKDFRLKTLSLGNKRRVSIAHVLLGKPQLVLLDEPFNGLDAAGVDDVLALIKNLNEQDGTTFLLSSHQLPYLEQICSHIAILHQGNIAVSDTIEHLLSDSKHIAMVKTPDRDKLMACLDTIDASYVHEDSEGFYHIALGTIEPAQLNQHLVSNLVAVAELHIKRASLSGLFRDITSVVNS
jgi:ABC-2 type transport system ATP-binding protein